MPAADRSPVPDPTPSWVRFAKSLLLYPRGSDRVRSAATALVDVLDAVRAETGRGEVRLVVAGERVTVAGREHDTDDPAHPWLAERLRRSALVGVVFAPEATPESLAGFSLRLLDNHAQASGEARFEELWPAPFAGVRPLARRFDGEFSARPGGGAGEAGGEADVPDWVARVLEDDAVAGALERAARAGATDGPTVPVTALCERIRAQLPADVASDPERAESVTRAVLANAIGANDPDPDALKSLIASVSEVLFARAASPEASGPAEPPAPVRDGDPPAPEAPAAPRPAEASRGHRGDDAITDDLGAFLAEYEGLPEGPARLLLAETDLVVEQLAVYLHYLLSLDSRPLAAAALKMIHALIEASEAEDLEVLVAYLGAETDDTADTIERLGAVLQEDRVLRALDSLGIFGHGWAVATFPETFPFYLDSLDLGDPREVSELCRACQAIGPARIFAAGHLIATESGLLRPGVAERILAAPFLPLSPLAGAMLRYGDESLQPIVARFLRSISTDAPKACLLWLHELEEIPRDYMLELIQVGPAPPSDKLRRLIARDLGRIAVSGGTEGAALAQRLRAIDLMSEFPSLESSDILTDLVVGKGLPLLSRAASQIRAAARTTIERMKSRAHV